MHNDPVSAVEIDAYLDGELDLRRRLAVEDHLARRPEEAARLMAELKARTALRLIGQIDEPPPRRLTDAADRLAARFDRPPRRGGLMSRMQLVAASVLAAIGVALVTLLPLRDARAKNPPYVADAVMSFETGMLRVAMRSQFESPVFDAQDVRRSTRIRVPTLPAGWHVTDVQLFPSDEGPALHMMVRTDQGAVASIFAVRSGVTAPLKPRTVRSGGASVAYWRHGDIAYALTGLEAPDALDAAAEDLADNRLD